MTPNAPDETPLLALAVGEKAVLTKLNTAKVKHTGTPSDSNIIKRLMNTGFIPGEPIQMLHKGFFGKGPIAVRIGQSTFALRRFEAALIFVIPVHLL